MVSKLTTIVTRSEGMPRNAAITHVRTLRKMTHRIKTKFGTSTDSFRASKSLPLKGLGQGSGAAAESWLSIERPLTQAYEKLTSAGILVTNPDGTKLFQQCKIGYVYMLIS